MAKVKKVPYYQMESSAIPFTNAKWKGYMGSEGCVPLNTQKSVSMDRLAPGELAPPSKPKPPKPTPEQRKAQQAEEDRQKFLAQQAKKQPQPKDKPQEKPPVPDAEECENPPVFDMLDIPDAMQKTGWPVSGKLARRWFNSPKIIWDNDKNSVLPIDDTTVTLDWVLKFGLVEWEYKKLLSESIYNENAHKGLKKKLKPILEKNFQNTVNLSFDTAPYLNDLRLFHMDWQFQRADIATYETLAKPLSMTDLTGALGNFGIYVAIGYVEVVGERYFKYDKVNQTKTYCVDPKIKITHIYVYVKDNYSFNDDPSSKKTQYLGHWNKKGMIVTTGGAISDLVDGKQSIAYTDMGNTRKVESHLNWDYLLSNPLDKPVDKRTGMIKKFREEDVYYPIYNKNFNDWRQKHNRDGDFWIYSKPKYLKLRKPIEFTMETLCRQPEKM